MHFVCFVVNPTNIFYPKKFLHRNMIILCRISVIYDIRLFNKFLNCLIVSNLERYKTWFFLFCFENEGTRMIAGRETMKYLMTFQGCCKSYHQCLESQGKSIICGS